ncbi:MAG: hypothetical protein ACKVS8_07435 [Phycisphaerales bacterium]
MNHPARIVACACAALALLGASCAAPPQLVAPEVLLSPYAGSATSPLWAVAPLVNESGTSTADNLAVTDAVVAKVAEARGLACVPTNRVIAAMRALGLASVSSPADARVLADALGVDALVVGSITAFDPYDPPTLGLTLGVIHRSSQPNTVDPRQLQNAAAEPTAPPSSGAPSVVVSEHLDGKNHEVLMSLKRYADGRHNPQGALGWRSYLASMDLYTEFAAYWTVGRLLDGERLRMSRDGLAAQSPPPTQP